MKYFYDTEFIEGTKKTWWGKTTPPTIDLISIGIVDEDGREYYAISKDFNLKESWNRWQPRTGEGDINNIKPRLYWLRDNVLKPIYKELHRKENLNARQALYRANIHIPETEFKFNYSNFKKLINKYGKTNKQIAQEVKEFCTGDELSIDKAKYYGVQHKPCKFYAYYADYDWVAFCWLFGKMIDLPNGFPMFAFDIQQLIIDNNIDKNQLKNEVPQIDSHNALQDAIWNKKAYEWIQKKIKQ